MKETDVDTAEAEQIGTAVTAGIEQLMSVSADRVYREPVRVGERVVIPAATIAYGGGFGFGAGGDAIERGGGGGGGGWNDGRPVAVIEASPDGVRIRPVIDFTRVGLTVVAAALAVWRAARR
jgi:uncharacterized spore protein YtfJ